ncbi:ribonuclease III [Temperatibacter marinus]|uniref:Ribonuclease 3 n=1 Tax=Temperatibacter marinus TaxID=1456591 RepID=A0AA52EBY3_9PROT|nr:ribonuclease III [Temperatibacter marinus]WND01981.1 ribonuclease III [Temperatibacter marinus]
MVNQIGTYKFSDPKLLEEALSHPSLAGKLNYQRLEFLGDRVLGLVTAEQLFMTFPNEAEGKLNNRFVSLVRKETLAEIAEESGIVKMITMSHGAEGEGTRSKSAVQSDVCEAVIGAIYLDGGLNPARDFVLKYIKPRMTQAACASKDDKTILQEWAQARGLALPEYTEVGRSGPDHSPVFEIIVSVTGYGEAKATGTSKRDAQQAAAKALLQTLESQK